MGLVKGLGHSNFRWRMGSSSLRAQVRELQHPFTFSPCNALMQTCDPSAMCWVHAYHVTFDSLQSRIALYERHEALDSCKALSAKLDRLGSAVASRVGASPALKINSIYACCMPAPALSPALSRKALQPHCHTNLTSA